MFGVFFFLLLEKKSRSQQWVIPMRVSSFANWVFWGGRGGFGFLICFGFFSPAWKWSQVEISVVIFFFLIIFFMTEEDKNWVPFAGLICAVLSILNCNTGIILF